MKAKKPTEQETYEFERSVDMLAYNLTQQKKFLKKYTEEEIKEWHTRNIQTGQV